MTREFVDLKKAFQKVVSNKDVWDEYFDTLIKQRTKNDDEKKQIIDILLNDIFERTASATATWSIDKGRWEEVFKRLKSAEIAPLLPANLPDRLTDLSLVMLEKATSNQIDYNEKNAWIAYSKYYADAAGALAKILVKPEPDPPQEPIAQPDVKFGTKQPIRMVRIVDGDTPTPPEPPAPRMTP